MKTTGLFGGSFNPVHMAHLVLAERVREVAGLDRVLFIPARRPPHKSQRKIAPDVHRMEMLRRATEPNPAFAVSPVELDRDGPSYTLTTVRELRGRMGEGAELSLILGADSVLDLPNWWHADELVREVDVIGFRRPGYDLSDLDELRRAFGDLVTERIAGSVIDAPRLEISATEIRHRVEAGRSVRYLVPECVRQYMKRNHVYPVGAG
ncbi:MAG: nicotinate-nucleotide adenylyltransferase [Candidatus Brocadiia bacterium]